MKLSVNLNKIALLRNSRGGDNPSPAWAARTCIAAGAHGLTLHWREDNRHTRAADVRTLCAIAREGGVELNLEGDTRPELIDLAVELRVAQVTLVPVTPGEVTSDHGWRLPDQHDLLVPSVQRARAAGCRVSIFVDAVPEDMTAAAATGADRVEIYTEPYAAAFGTERQQHELDRVRATARAAVAAGLGVNAGHDLSVRNLPTLAREVPEVAEVSIGHALVCDALYVGLDAAVRAFLAATRGEDAPYPRTV
jgi:pyridoxine 5-phosphate synthase